MRAIQCDMHNVRWRRDEPDERSKGTEDRRFDVAKTIRNQDPRSRAWPGRLFVAARVKFSDRLCGRNGRDCGWEYRESRMENCQINGFWRFSIECQPCGIDASDRNVSSPDDLSMSYHFLIIRQSSFWYRETRSVHPRLRCEVRRFFGFCENIAGIRSLLTTPARLLVCRYVYTHTRWFAFGTVLVTSDNNSLYFAH